MTGHPGRPQRSRLWPGFVVIGWLWCGLTAYVIWAGEHVPATQHTRALKQMAQKAAPAPGAPAAPQPAPNTPAIDKTLADLHALAEANLRIREDAERAANWAELTLKLIGGISLLVLGASALGGYSLLTSAKDQAALTAQANTLVQGVERDLGTKTNEMQRLYETERARLAEQTRKNTEALQELYDQERTRLAEKTAEIEARQASLSRADERVNALVQEIERKAVMMARGVTAEYAKFDFSKLDAAAESLLPRVVGRLPAEERARIEDYDVQIQLAEILGAEAGADVYFKLGRYYRFAGNHARALVRLDKATQRGPGNFDAWMEKIICYVVLARSEPAGERQRDLLDKAFSDGLDKARPLAQTPLQKFHLHFLEGWLLDEVRRYPEAITAYEESRRYMLDERIDYNIACSLAKDGRLAEAMAKLEAITDATLIASAAEDEDLGALRTDPTFGPRLQELIRRAGGASGTGAA